MKPTFFATPTEFRGWLEKHHDEAEELWVGFHKKDSGKPSITWPEAVDEVLCFGWIDGQRKSIDDTSYAIRFTRRKARSIWSAVNLKRVPELAREGRMHTAGRNAFEQRVTERSRIYSYEQRRAAQLEDAHEKRFRANRKAWDFFQAAPPSYRKAAIWWVTSAKAEETKLRRLAKLIDDSEHGRTVPPLTPPSKRK
jgi:uncharacterized protein YdeI (YjbR/CyaY-like superfamily)